MADNPPEKKPGYFTYTQGKTWGGSQIDPKVFKIITVCFGFFGIDHLILRSPITAILKFIVNIFSLGFWYWYDILQVFSDFDNLKKYGYSIPIYGPVGLGAGILHDPGKPHAPPTSPTPFYFLGFFLTSLIPYGISHVIAGDYLGAFLKFILSISFFTFLFGWLWALYTFGNAVFNSKSLFSEGTDRLFPLSLIFGKYGPAPNLKIYVPVNAEAEPDCPPGTFDVFLDSIWKTLTFLPTALLDIIKSAYEVLFPPVKKAVDAATVVFQETKKAAEVPIKEVSKIAMTMPKVLTDTVGELASYTDPSKLAELAEKQSGIQSGGALLTMDEPSLFNMLVVGILIASIVGGLAVTYLRINEAKTEPKSEKNDVPPTVQRKERNDAPPGP